MAGDALVMQQDDWFTPTLSPKAFMRRLPRGFVPHDRVVLDSLILSADMIDLYWRSLSATAIGIGSDLSNITPLVRANLFSSAWGIIDQVHSIRYMTRRLVKSGTPGPKTAAFISETEVATLVRNKLDHIHQHLPNTLASSKAFPIFGVLGWIFWGTAPEFPLHLVSVSGGASAATGSWDVGNPLAEPLRVPLDRLSLQLGGYEVRLIALVRAVRNWLAVQDGSVEIETIEQLTASAERKGLDVATVLADLEGPMDVIIEMRPEDP